MSSSNFHRVGVPDIEDRERLRDLVTRRALVNQDRLKGKTPLSVETVGEHRFYWGATGSVTNGATARIYLTMNAGVGGPGVFGKIPGVNVFRDLDATPGGLPRAVGTLDPTKTMRLRHHANYDLIWDGPNQVWVVEITNDSGATAGFAVRVGGLS